MVDCDPNYFGIVFDSHGDTRYLEAGQLKNIQQTQKYHKVSANKEGGENSYRSLLQHT